MKTAQGTRLSGSKKSKKTSRRRHAEWNGELVYVFKGVSMLCSVNSDVYDGDGLKAALDQLDVIAREIWIDKTYVDFEGTKFKKTFLLEGGWNELRDLVKATDYGADCTRTQTANMDAAFRAMIIGYVDMAFAELGWDVENMAFDVAENAKFRVEYHKDVGEEWRNYVGPWQAWRKPGAGRS